MSIFRRALHAVRSAVGLRPTPGEDEGGSTADATPADQPVTVDAFTIGSYADESSLPCGQFEFIGGPLDGLTQRLPIAFEELAVVVAVPISPRSLAKLTGNAAGFAGKSPAPTTVAFYELDVEQLIPLRYLFVGATSPNELSLP